MIQPSTLIQCESHGAKTMQWTLRQSQYVWTLKHLVMPIDRIYCVEFTEKLCRKNTMNQ